jgi:histidinol-phosphate/aromatic aminotransferase/cobyric acid decarboxylase-like protein
VFEALEKRRILVRYFRGPLTQDSLRISIGTDADMETCLQALRAALTQG